MTTTREIKRPLLVWLKKTGLVFDILLKAIFICLAFCGIGAALAPLVFIGLILGMFPNILKAVYSFVITIPMLIALPFHAIYLFLAIILKREPDYSKGVYGVVDWIERNQLYNPSYRKQANPAST
jgi:hypothetical protein